MTGLHVERTGPRDGRSVVLLHGGGVAGWMWHPLRRHLPEALDLIVPDLPGHGRSRGVPFVSRAAVVEQLIRLLRHDVGRPAAVVGFSFGAQVAIELAAEAPELVSHVTVISAQAAPTPLPGLTLGLLAAAAPLARNATFARAQAKELFIPDELMDAYLDESRAFDRRTLTGVVGENIRFTIPAGWSRFPGSAAVLVGARERRMMIDSSRMLHAALPSSTLEIVDDRGHGIPLQCPALLAARLRAQWAPTPGA